jgi:hypothetical protein
MHCTDTSPVPGDSRWQTKGRQPHVHPLCETRADVYENAVQCLEEALIDAFGLWDIVTPEPDP